MQNSAQNNKQPSVAVNKLHAEEEDLAHAAVATYRLLQLAEEADLAHAAVERIACCN